MSKVLLSVDERLLRRIDRRARAKGMSRSAYVAELARRDLSPSRASADAALARLDRLFERADASAGDATAAIRAERDAR